jgi:hypothetical protein
MAAYDTKQGGRVVQCIMYVVYVCGAVHSAVYGDVWCSIRRCSVWCSVSWYPGTGYSVHSVSICAMRYASI